MKQKSAIFLSVMIIIIGVAIAGGTYAYFSSSVSLVNESYTGHSDCFLIDYNINNDGNNGQDITGTLFPASGPLRPGSLGGKVTMSVSSACNVNGIGTLTMSINNTTSSVFGTVVAAHCENATTLETLNDYKTSSACTTNGGSWVTNGTALKYAVYDTNTNGNPVSVGYVTSSMISSGSATIYTNFNITRTAKSYYIYLWLDGYNSHANAGNYENISFSGAINALARQTDQFILPDEYQKVEYVSKYGAVNINTIPDDNYGVYARIKNMSFPNDSIPKVYFGSSNDGMNGKKFFVRLQNNQIIYDWNSSQYTVTQVPDTTTINTIKFNYLNSRTLEYNNEIVATNIPTFSGSTYPIYLSALNRGGTSTNNSAGILLYEFKISADSQVIVDLVPCYRKNDSTAGLYDIINGIFYYESINGSSFTAGPDVN